MRIRVTQDHIDAGIFMEGNGDASLVLSRCQRCPVALALSSAGFVDCEVGAGHIDLGNGSFSIAVPEKMRDLIYAFDNGHRIKPFSFELTDDNQIVMVK